MKLKNKWIRRFLLTLTTMICVPLFSYAIYHQLTFNIEEYMLQKEFQGDVEKYEKAKESGRIKYCKKYVLVEYGGPHMSIWGYRYYRVSDGRWYSVSGTGSICHWILANKKWYFRIIGYDPFDKNDWPLTCEAPSKNDLECPENCTGFECAIKYNEINSVKRLLEKGADPKLKNDQGKTALDIAKERSVSQEILELLE